ncbi:M15 family metallopeptidase domain-containing protein [Streptomyces cellulosae]|uniref:hypothetical protein n=1 Tax=Streptomyces cellulosae TaxID=1968 RepID=UPI002D21D985|nr:hypothetical protein [Streptomyces cellulosae]
MDVIAAITAACGQQSQNSSDSAHTRGHRGATGGAVGAVPDGVTAFDDEIPAAADLDPDLFRAFRQAARDAAEDAAEFHVNSGRRSPEHQNQHFRRSEPWLHGLRTDAIDRGCPRGYADPTQEPRTQQ